MNQEWQTPEFPITVCVPGEAEHSHDLNIGDLTVRPRLLNPSFFHGAGLPKRHFKGAFNPIFLWPQELWVYLLELTPYMRVQVLLNAIEEQALADEAKFGSDNIGGSRDNYNLYKHTREKRRWG